MQAPEEQQEEEKINILNQKLYEADPDQRDGREGLLDGTCFQKALYNNLTKVINIGCKKPYTNEDLFSVPDQFKYKDYKNFEGFYEQHGGKYRDNFMGMIIAYFSKAQRIPYILFTIKYIIEVPTPLILRYFLNWLQEDDPDMLYGYLYAVVLALSLIIRSYFQIYIDFELEAKLAARMRNTCRALIVNKIANLDPGAFKYVDIGKVSTHISVDIEKFAFYLVFRPHIFLAPPAMIAYLVLIYLELGLITAALAILAIIMVLAQKLIMGLIQSYNKRRLGKADIRGRRINEILAGVKIIKFSAWEKVMFKVASSLRAEETYLIQRQKGWDSLSRVIPQIVSMLFGVVGFTLYSVFNNGARLNLGQVYEMITLFNSMLSPLAYLIMSLNLRAETISSSQRMSNLVKLEPKEVLEDDHSLDLGELEVKGGCFNWESPKYYQIFNSKRMKEETQQTYILKTVNLTIKPGEFVAVIGKVGSGKSSLLLALMDEMVRQEGTVKKNGAIAYISQEAFLQNDTLENNVVYGKEYNRDKFEQILEMCQMLPDLAILPGREKAEIGERGLNMSGGQKQRINIARAVYSDSDIYIIDDALSALDAYVGKKIMDGVFMGKLKGKTRVMVTNYLHLLEHVDRVVLMEKGRIRACGTLDEVRETEAFKRFANAKREQVEKNQDGDDPEDIFEDNDDKDIDSEGNHGLQEEPKDTEEELKKSVKQPIEESAEKLRKKLKKSKKSSLKKSIVEMIDQSPILTPKLETEQETKPKQNQVAQVDDIKKQEAGKLTKAENRDTGVSSLKPYIFYFSRAGLGISILGNLLYIFAVCLKLLTEWWAGRWALGEYKLTNQVYIEIYISIAAVGILIFSLKSLVYGKISSNAAYQFFVQVLWNVLRRPMSFFDTTPSGVIINRCTNDMDQIDTFIPWFLEAFTGSCYTYIFSFALAAVSSPVLLVVIVISGFILVNAFVKFLKTTIEMKRLAQLSLAALISVASEFIDGAAVVRCYGRKRDMLKKYEKKANLHHKCFLHDDSLFSWIRIRLEFCIVFAIIVVIFTVVLNQQVKILAFSDPGTTGLIISTLIPITGMLASLMYPMIKLVKAGVSVDRLKEYINWNIFEKPFSTPEAPSPDWPTRGSIKATNLSIRYRKGLPLVLKGVNFDIKPGEKVAFIGRTGSGKSTTLLALMRILEMAKDERGTALGSLEIDGQNIAHIGLHQLRGRVGIIPQDPYLFEGTLRFNLDPSEAHTDEELIDRLKAVSVLDTIKSEDLINQRIKELKEKAQTKFKSLKKEKQEEIVEKFGSADEYIQTTENFDLDPQIARIKEQGATNADKLKFKLEGKGVNLSIGQRQLVCIARALVDKPKIFLMDEATANIDQKTDSIIQGLIKSTLTDTTVVTIAHRLLTIIQYDKVVVLEEGRKVEQGSPSELLEKDGGFFWGLVKEGGEEFFGKMKQAAGDWSIDPAELFAE